MTRDVATALYTDGLEPEKAALVRRIYARHGDEFQTRRFVGQDSDESQSQYGEKWLQASCVDAAKNLWRVERYETVPDIYPDEDGNLAQDPDGLSLKIDEIHENLCFFDALYVCASFENAALTEGLTPAGPDKAAMGDLHYRAFADREGLPFDKTDNMPVPAANGQKLVKSGRFDMNVQDTLARSRENLLPAEQIRTAFYDSVAKPAPASAGTSTALIPAAERSKSLEQRTKDARRTQMTRQQSQKILERNHKALKGLHKTFAGVVKRDFKYDREGGPGASGIALCGTLGSFFGFGGISTLSVVVPGAAHAPLAATLLFGSVGVVASVGGIGLLGLLGVAAYAGVAQNELALARLDMGTALKKLPDESPLKQELTQTKKDYELAAYSLLYRKACRDLAEKGGWRARRRHSKAVKKLVRSCENYGMDQGQTARFLDGLDQDRNDRAIDRHIFETMQAQLEALADHVEDIQRDAPIDLQALPASPTTSVAFERRLKNLPG